VARHVCEVPGCMRRSSGKKYCNKHYRALKMYGDPLTVEKIERGVSEDKYKFLQIALKAITDECIFWKHDTLKIGTTARIIYNGKEIYVSRFVCELVHGAPPSEEHQAAHSCGNGHLWCINGRHLSWKTPLQNRGDMVLHGTNNYNRGEKNAGAKLIEADVLDILRDKVSSINELAIRHNVHPSQIRAIKNRTTWSWLVDPDFKYDGPDYFK
jgi:hypothetical protein